MEEIIKSYIVKDIVITYKHAHTGGVGSSRIISIRPKTEEDFPSEDSVRISHMFEKGVMETIPNGTTIWTAKE